MPETHWICAGGRHAQWLCCRKHTLRNRHCHGHHSWRTPRHRLVRCRIPPTLCKLGIWAPQTATRSRLHAVRVVRRRALRMHDVHSEVFLLWNFFFKSLYTVCTYSVNRCFNMTKLFHALRSHSGLALMDARPCRPEQQCYYSRYDVKYGSGGFNTYGYQDGCAFVNGTF